MLTEEQKKARKKGIGGSDVASVLNIPPYGCSRMLFYDKRNYTEDFDDVNPNMERGIYLEDIACVIYAKQSGNKVRRRKAMASKKHPFMFSNIDRDINDPTLAQALGGVLEVKCPNRDSFLRIKRLGIPEYYLLQGQHYLSVNDKTWMDYAIFCADLWKMEIIRVERDEELIAMIIEAEEHFWKIKENGPIPDRLELGDKCCKGCNWRLTCWGEMWEDTGDEFEDSKDYEDFEDPEFVEVAGEHKDNIGLLKLATENADATKKKLMDIVGDREKVICPSGKVCFKWEKKTLLDTKKLKKEEPDMAKKYQYETGSKPFRFYPSK
jgi:putative phage-type endonuclease